MEPASVANHLVDTDYDLDYRKSMNGRHEDFENYMENVISKKRKAIGDSIHTAILSVGVPVYKPSMSIVIYQRPSR